MEPAWLEFHTLIKTSKYNNLVDPWLLLIVGLILAGVGGECFVRGLVGIAHWMRIPSGIIAATIAAFATSSPEFTVAIHAATAGAPAIALGDALGSNVVNVALVLGIALLFGPLHAERGAIKRDLPVALLGPVVTALLLIDGYLSRIDAVLMLAMFIAWLVVSIREAARARSAAEEVLGEKSHVKAILISACGLVCLVLAGGFIVDGAKVIGDAMGWDPFVVGATLVALGTSTPELATVLVSRIRKHDEVGLGTVLGSNIFNGFWIVAVAALIHPIEVQVQVTVVGLVFGLVSVLLIVPRRGSVISRRVGLLLVALYAAYVVVMIQSGGPPPAS